MKKFFLTVLLLVCTSLAFSQMTNTEIMKMISRSKEANLKAGVTNPNLILPGQTLTFLFEDGKEVQLTVEPGDNQWNIVKSKLIHWQSVHGPVVDYPQPTKLPLQSAKTKALDGDTTYLIVSKPPIKSGDNALGFPWETLFIVVLAIGGVLFLVWLVKRLFDLNADPVTAGPAQVPGGVNDAHAYERLRQIAESRSPGARLEIRNIRRGHLSGLAKVFYQGKKAKKINLKNVPAYAGEILVNGIEQTIYFLQGCGNDARMGNYMSGDNLVFTPNVVINQDGSESPLVPTPVVPQPAPVTSVVDPGSEFHQHVEKAEDIVGKFLEGNDAKHRVYIKITHDTFEATIENKYDQNPKKATPAAEKKE
jgi:hypothetical protein